MGKIVATYHVKVTLREPDASADQPADAALEAPAEPPTIATVEEGVGALFSIGGLVANATAERTDK